MYKKNLLPDRVTISSCVICLFAKLCVSCETLNVNPGTFCSTSETKDTLPSRLPAGTVYVGPNVCSKKHVGN